MNKIVKVSSMIVFLLLVIFFGSAQAQCPAGTTMDSEINLCVPANSDLPDPPGGVTQVIINVMNWLLIALASFAIIGFVISGMQYLLSAGDDKRIATAKRNMVYCIIGVIVGIAGYVIITAIDSALRGNQVW